MKKGIDLVKEYFEATNNSDFKAVREVLAEDIGYISQQSGTYKGIKEVLVMQKAFHKKFSKLNWKMLDVDESEEDGEEDVVTVEFEFNGKKKTGEEVMLSGTEIFLFQAGKIASITIYNH